jgi:protein tyrosine/serine phosphatase
MLKWAAIMGALIVVVGARASLAVAAPTTMPVRFAQVGPRLYRGGQPSEAQLAELYARGVRTVICLRSEHDVVANESAAAGRLGMRFLNFGFSGFHDPDPALLHKIVAAMQDGGDGAVYVHCRAGRDRTSLVVALYRVWVDAWAPGEAWRREADDYGHGGWQHWFFRKLDRAFYRLTAPAAAVAQASAS